MTTSRTTLPAFLTAEGLSLIADSAFLVVLPWPAAAGLLVAVVPAPTTLLMLVACWFAAALITALMPLAPAAEDDMPAASESAGTSLWHRVVRHPVLLVSIVVGVGSGLITAPLTSVVLPAYFRDVGEPALFGVAVALTGAGSLVGSIVYAALASRAPGLAYAVMVALTTTGFALIATLPVFPLVLTAQLAIGLGAGVLGPFVMVAITRNTAEAERGRVLGLFNALGLGASPAGLVMFAPLVAVAGIGGGAVAILAG